MCWCGRSFRRKTKNKLNWFSRMHNSIDKHSNYFFLYCQELKTSLHVGSSTTSHWELKILLVDTQNSTYSSRQSAHDRLRRLGYILSDRYTLESWVRLIECKNRKRKKKKLRDTYTHAHRSIRRLMKRAGTTTMQESSTRVHPQDTTERI